MAEKRKPSTAREKEGILSLLAQEENATEYLSHLRGKGGGTAVFSSHPERTEAKLMKSEAHQGGRGGGKGLKIIRARERGSPFGGVVLLEKNRPGSPFFRRGGKDRRVHLTEGRGKRVGLGPFERTRKEKRGREHFMLFGLGRGERGEGGKDCLIISLRRRGGEGEGEKGGRIYLWRIKGRAGHLLLSRGGGRENELE